MGIMHLIGGSNESDSCGDGPVESVEHGEDSIWI